MKKFFTIGFILLQALSHDQVLAQAGSLDLSYGNNGKVATTISPNGGHSYGYASAIQSDGKILVAGSTYIGNNLDFAVARFNTDGSLDNTFSGDGKVSIDIGDLYDYCYGISIQSNGKIILSGSTSNSSKMAIVRLNASGILDSTFDSDGIFIPTISTSYVQGFRTVIQSDDKIVAATQSINGANVDFTIIRLNTNGSMDSTFSNDGIAYADIAGDDIASTIALQSDGKIVVGGISGNTDFSLVRFETNGNLDPTFDTDGKLITAVTIGQDEVSSIAIQNDGKIILAGTSNISGNVHLLVRYLTNGSLDTTFDTDGMVITNNTCLANDIKVQADGKIVVAGTYPVGGSMDFAVVRYNTNGSLDLTFDTDGSVTTDFGASKDDRAHAISIQNDGKIVAVGYGYNGSYTDFMVMRYLPGVVTSLNNIVGSGVNLYPNPAKGILEIKNVEDNYRIKIFNNFGQMVYEQKCTSTKSIIDISSLSAGFYNILVQGEQSNQALRFVKE